MRLSSVGGAMVSALLLAPAAVADGESGPKPRFRP
jgi:ABC-type Mn2+/Zn2+ transport system permease subunit